MTNYKKESSDIIAEVSIKFNSSNFDNMDSLVFRIQKSLYDTFNDTSIDKIRHYGKIVYENKHFGGDDA